MKLPEQSGLKMNLRKATSLVIAGLAYTVLHKVLYTLFPSIGRSDVGTTLTSALWIVAAFSIVFFAYQWLRELRPQNMRIRLALIFIMIFTGLVIVSRLPLGLMAPGGTGHRLLMGGSGLLNSLAILTFLLCLAGSVSNGTRLWWPLRSSILALGLTFIIGLVSAAYFLSFLTGGKEPGVPPFLQPLSALVFLFAYSSVIWFLIRFRELETFDLFNGI